ncbi:hypothetical protein NDU88_005489 [Pleurodeles waltl]|uniref:Uncharacterized protein n=1 Tax=Pleurodeles waltl TaxID=8319 RepID=A0AAV7WY09_PLEWA|nr:hypothetical protein NDU88_005489 [Pleurodeles waltl]
MAVAEFGPLSLVASYTKGTRLGHELKTRRGRQTLPPRHRAPAESNPKRQKKRALITTQKLRYPPCEANNIVAGAFFRGMRPLTPSRLAPHGARRGKQSVGEIRL